MRDLFTDIRYSPRILRRSPIFSITAVAVLALMTRFLFGVAEHDSVVFIGVPSVVVVAALVAVWLPARAIVRVDTIRALRSE